MSNNTPPPNPHSTSFVQEHLPAIVEQISRDGLNAHPLVFGTNQPDAVLISAGQYRALSDYFDDLLDESFLRKRLSEVPDDDDLELISPSDLKKELGLELDEE
ncbi:hypothetical protein ABZ234_07925 [Nocardiopsis sp. NPDC006198]|uniref:hypothetical protein n=1 Tax=Nocardiopsis sp. NPDC006198 TaxID=3154472 RepID=UPI0033BCED26